MDKNTDAAIEVRSLAKSFGNAQVLCGVDLTVPRGETYAFLGRNGEGKTTTIRTMLGLLAPDGGTLSIDGLDPLRDSIELRRRVGYLAEDQKSFDWLTVADTLAFVRPFYPTWDDALASKLLDDFALPPKTKVGKLSKGQNVRLGLLLALAHQPQIVILDDPALGLDPIMRKEFLRDVIEHLQGRGATVFFSSHLLYEIEPVADRVAILNGGRIVVESTTEALRESVRRFILPPPLPEGLLETDGLLDLRAEPRRTAIVPRDAVAFRDRLHGTGIDFEEQGLSLDEIFEAFVVGRVEEAAVHA